jgi:hypothetical protein
VYLWAKGKTLDDLGFTRGEHGEPFAGVSLAEAVGR